MPLIQDGPPGWMWERTPEALKREVVPSDRPDGLRIAGAVRPGGVFWRRVLRTCHHRTQVQTWLRLAGHEPVPAI
jgi:hypothetical protein